MKIPRRYKHEYVCCLPKELENSIMEEIRQNISELALNKEEKVVAIENANLSKACDLTDTIEIEYMYN